jgi:hypothetical protein
VAGWGRLMAFVNTRIASIRGDVGDLVRMLSYVKCCHA